MDRRSPRPVQYRADPPALRPVVEAEGMTVLYHRPSGATHVLLPPAPEILDLLGRAPADAAALADGLVALYGAEADGPIADVVAARLAELVAAGLVRAA